MTGTVDHDELAPASVTSTMVSEICAPALLLGVQLRSAQDFGDPSLLRRRMRELLDRTEEQLRDARLTAPDVSDIAFALVAFLDESISQSSWNRKAEWLATPMQYDRFKRYDAGEEFFTRLAGLPNAKPPRSDVHQIYFLCLTLGFKGKYRLLADEEWHELVSDVGMQFRRAGDQSRAPLAPNALPGEVLAQAVKEIPVWVFAVAAASVAFLVYVVLMILISGRARGIEELLRLQ